YEADGFREERERQPALEDAFRSELLLQPPERGEVVAQPESLDRERPQTKVAFRLEQLRAAEHMNALAVSEVESQGVEARACDRHAETCAVARIFEREEDGLPARVAAQFGHFAFDPDRRQTAQPVCDAAVERRDGIDLAVAVLDRLDLHPGIVCPACVPPTSRLR